MNKYMRVNIPSDVAEIIKHHANKENKEMKEILVDCFNEVYIYPNEKKRLQNSITKQEDALEKLESKVKKLRYMLRQINGVSSVSKFRGEEGWLV